MKNKKVEFKILIKQILDNLPTPRSSMRTRRIKKKLLNHIIYVIIHLLNFYSHYDKDNNLIGIRERH